MKKTILALIILFAGLGMVNAQNFERRDGGGQGAQMAEMIKERIKKDLKLNDAQVDTVMAIQQEAQKQTRAVRMNSELSEDEKATKMKEIKAERETKLKAILDEKQYKKLEEMNENMRQAMEQRRRENQGFQN